MLLRINPDIYVSNVDRLQASLDNARSNLANSRSRLVQAKARFIESQAAYNRNKKLYNDKVLSEQEWETATSAYEVAKAEVSASEETVQGAAFSVKVPMQPWLKAVKTCNVPVFTRHSQVLFQS